MVQGRGNPMLEEWDCKGGEKVEGRRAGSGGGTISGRTCVEFGDNRVPEAVIKKGVR